jgi:prepilin-type N-terminal cleavage/methylation domain-containing protein
MTTKRIHTTAGFSIIELMVVLAILSIIMGAVFQVIALTTERSSTEQTKLDMFQEAREFMDQMSRDLRQAGYPNPRNVAANTLTQVPVKNDPLASAGIVKVADGDLWFEADVDGIGTVSVIRYHLDTSTTNGCPCLKRSQINKKAGDPVTGQDPEIYQVQVQGVQNTDIFTAWANAAVVTLPRDLTNDPTEINSIDTIQARLSLRAATFDPKTKQYPATTLVSTVKLNNCTQALPTSCM